MPSYIKKYNKNKGISYTLGMSITIELLQHMPNIVETVYLSSKVEKNDNTINLQGLCSKHGIPIEKNDKIFNMLSPKGNCFAIGVFRKYKASLTDGAHLLFSNPADAGNLGSIIRTAVGFGIKNIAIIKPAVDVFDPKTIRASMGALFLVNFEYFDNISQYRERFIDNNLYAFMLDAQTPLHSAKFAAPYTLVFGNEARGLPGEYANFCQTIVIPHSDEIDSLNLPIASSIAMYMATIPNKNI